MRIEIEVQDSRALLDIMGISDVKEKTAITIPGNAELRFIGSKKRVGILPGLTEVLVLSLNFGLSIGAGLIANWLYDKFKRAGSNIKTTTYTDSALQEKNLEISSVHGIQEAIVNTSRSSVFTPKDLYEFFCKVEWSSKLTPVIEGLKQSGGFSHKFAGILERIHKDTEYRQKIFQSQNIELTLKGAKAYGLPYHEVFLLPIIAGMIETGDINILVDADKVEFGISKPPSEVAAKLGKEPIDFSKTRPEKVIPLITKLSEKKGFAQQVHRDAAFMLGHLELNRSEFFLVYVFAIIVCGYETQRAEWIFAPTFCETIGMSMDEIREVRPKAWEFLKRILGLG